MNAHGRRAGAALLALLVFGPPLLRPAGAVDPPPAGTVVLLPIDDRPAVAQFARMIGAIADHEVVMPPAGLLGRFTQPGDTQRLSEWLRGQDYSRVDALVVSSDMLAFGGLIASRAPAAPEKEALGRLEFFRWFKKAHPGVPVFAFSVIMRVAPTAEAANRAWRDDLARWSELKDRVPRSGEASLKAELEALEKKLDAKVIRDYLAARKRGLAVNLAMIDLRRQGIVDTLILLQDDARVYGLHRQDQQALTARLEECGLKAEVPVYNGADEGSLSLVSRALMRKYRESVKVAVDFSSPKGRGMIVPYEDHPLEYTVESQIRASGAAVASAGERPDYTLFVNSPGTTAREFENFLDRLLSGLRQGKRIALADVLFPAPHLSGADERIVRAIEREGLVDRFTAYAAWNTAGNTLGTAIPQANMRILFLKRINGDPRRAARSLAGNLEFLLHRFVGDFIYHDIVRFGVNLELRGEAGIPTDEFPPEVYDRVNRTTMERLEPLAEKFFGRHFLGRSYALEGLQPPRSIRIRGLRDLSIHLPWPRNFEVTVEYRLAFDLVE